MPPRRTHTAAMALVVVMAVLSGLQGVLERLGAEQHPPPATGPVVDLLATLPVAPEAGADSYERDHFGTGWATGPDGCDTRTRVLVDESLTPAVVDGCAVAAGEWVSVYDTTRVTDPAALDIDHLVPLAEAWSSGAASWSDEQRREFANDIDPSRPDALIAVTASSNRAKGDGDPGEWMPPDRGVWCRYATAWVAQKAAWHLAVDEAEQQALAVALATCPPEGVAP